jgi:hypothetical protein
MTRNGALAAIPQHGTRYRAAHRRTETQANDTSSPGTVEALYVPNNASVLIGSLWGATG